MAPTCADPRQVVIALEPPQRRQLWDLVRQAISEMTKSIQPTPDKSFGSVAPKDDVQDEENNGDQKPKNPQPQKPQEVRQQQDEQDEDGIAICRAAVKHLEEWRKEFLPRLKEILQVQDDNKIVAERKKRREELSKRSVDTAEDGEDLMTFDGDVQVSKSDDINRLQKLYRPIPTDLVKLPIADRREAVGCILLLLLFTGKYSAHSRALALYLASSLELPTAFINNEEGEIAKSLMESGTADDKQKDSMSAEAEAAKRREENKVTRFWKVGLASVAGAAVVGITGGLAAPLVAGALGGIMGGVGLGGVASFLGVFWMNGALVGTLFGAYGAKMTGEMMDQYAKEVEDFRFIPLQDPPETPTKDKPSSSSSDNPPPEQTQDRRLRVTIGINGWLNNESDVTTPWQVLPHDTEVFALRYELAVLLQLGSAMRDLVSSVAWKTLKSEIIKRTVLAALWAALWPIKLLATASNVDNPFSRASNRSKKAGELMADALINRVQGERPVVLVGYSLGATAIHSCLQSLAERRAFGLVDTVVLIGCPAPSTSSHWRTLRSVVSGRIFNVYSENDMMLGFVYRMHSLALGVAGLQPIKDVDGVINVDLSNRVSGHLRYPSLTGEILSQCGFVGVKATGDIEKDDVIRAKEEHAGGNLIDINEEAERPGVQRAETSKSKSSEQLEGLNLQSPSFSSPSHTPSRDDDEEKPPTLPQRPVLDDSGDEKPPTLPQRPSQHNGEDEKPPTLPRRPTAANDDQEDGPRPALPIRPASQSEARGKKPVEYKEEVKRRPLTPTSNDSDDEEYRGIAMVDNDSDEEEDSLAGSQARK